VTSSENEFLRFEFNPLNGMWSVFTHMDFPSIKNIQLSLQIFVKSKPIQLHQDWQVMESMRHADLLPSHITGQTLSFVADFFDERLSCELIFALPEGLPFLLWKMIVNNLSKFPVEIGKIELLSLGYSAHGAHNPQGQMDFDGQKNHRSNLPSQSDFAFFSNGWQSWSYTGVYRGDEHYRRTRLGFLRDPVSRYYGTPRPNGKGKFVSDMFAVLGNHRSKKGVLIGFLSQREQFGSIQVDISTANPKLRSWANGDRARLDPGKNLSTDWSYLEFIDLEETDPLGTYLDTVAVENRLEPNSVRLNDPITGWCSWYQYSSEDYTGAVTARDIYENVMALRDHKPDLPLQIIQIDDGYETKVGDWRSWTAGFPDGVAPLADQIRESGFTPGLWLSPFVVHPRSRLAADHPDWLLRNEHGRPVSAGFLWGTLTPALDLTHPEAMSFVQELVDQSVNQWGFEYLKLDFLYAAALTGIFQDATKTKAQVLHAGLSAIRTAAGPKTYLLGCGCPLGPAIGILDAMRISPDTARRWRPSFKGIEWLLKNEPDLPSSRNAVHNNLTRAALHQRWWVNDPDCLLLRPGTQLSLAEIQTNASVVALSGGSLILSDSLAELPEDRLRLASTLLPAIGKRSLVLDWFERSTPEKIRLDLEGALGKWHLIALFNWMDSPQTLTFRLTDFNLDPAVGYIGREFWLGEIYNLGGDDLPKSILTYKEVPAHGVRLLAIRPYQPSQPVYIGSNLHISQGLEVNIWQPHHLGLSFTIQRPFRSEGVFDLFLPRSPRSVFQDGQRLNWSVIGESKFRFKVCVSQATEIEMDYE
jgi:alpha-galactosidase